MHSEKLHNPCTSGCKTNLENIWMGSSNGAAGAVLPDEDLDEADAELQGDDDGHSNCIISIVIVIVKVMLVTIRVTK